MAGGVGGVGFFAFRGVKAPAVKLSLASGEFRLRQTRPSLLGLVFLSRIGSGASIPGRSTQRSRFFWFDWVLAGMGNVFFLTREV